MKTLFRILCLLMLLSSHHRSNAQVPLLNSYPSAAATIFLDFDGHTVSGTSWNYNGDFVCGGSGLSNTQIIEIFNRIAEDYRPFNINITTDSTKFLAAPAKKRMRVILTVTSSWYGSAGGVAFVGSFTWGDDNPCFVFSALLNYNTKYIAEAASHEAGHTLGMYHQAAYDANCVKTSDYYSGTGSGEIGWAPIMGVGYYRNFTLWNNGPNSYGCSNYQSDLDVITSAANGFGYRTDDHDSTFASASLYTFSSNQFTASGVIERNVDEDMIKFHVPAIGRLQLNAVPYNVGTGNSGSDLDMQVTLYDNAQNVLNIYNPGTLLSSLVDTTLNGGTYYLKVEGKGNLYAPAYASLGSYSLQASYNSSIVLPMHRLELRGTQNGDKHQLSWLIDADEKVVQQILEVSTDGRNFNPLTEANNNSRAYVYKPSVSGTTQYRLNVTFDNGNKYYSNIILIRDNSSAPRPKLMGNIINSSSIYVSSPANYSYAIIDFNGRTINSGQLTSGINNINTNSLTSGMYIIRFTGNEQQWTDKLIRQ
ncbi:MAG: zinc-dependent metalloprotease [Chitinophagaceae bacterium]